MEQKKRQDDMEEFFRKAFDELGDAPSDDGWDRPSPGVWTGIQAALPATKLQRLGQRWAWGALLFLFLLPLGILYWQNRVLGQQLKEQATALQQMQVSLDSLYKDWTKQEGGSRKPETTNVGGVALLGNDTEAGFRQQGFSPLPQSAQLAPHTWGQHTRLSRNRGISATPPVPTGSGNQLMSPARTPWPAHIISEAGSKKEGALAASSTQLAPRQEHQTFKTTSYMPRGSALQPLRPFANPPIASITTAPAISLTPVKPLAGAGKPSFYLGGYTAYNHTSRVVGHKPNQPGRALFEVQENGQGSLEWGLRAGLQLSPRWAVESGLSAFSIRQESRQAFRVRYDPGRERPVGSGQLEATYALAIPSAYGTSELDVDLRRAASQPLLPGAYLALEVHAQQRLRFVSIPLTLHYHLLNRRFQLGLKGGLALSFLQSTSLQTTVQSRRAGLMVPDARVRERFAEVRSANLDYLLGLSAHYRLTPSLSLVLEPTYRKNLQPLTESPNFSSSAFAWGLQAGVNYRF
jgi:hypothetical protein